METNSFAEHLQFLEEFFRQILPEVNADAMEYLNNLINRVYMRRGIDEYTNLNTLKAEDFPTFDNLYDCILEEFQNTQSEYLRNNLRVLMSYVAKFSTGGRNSNMWNGYSTLSTVENFIVFNFQSLLANRNNTIAQMLLVLKYLDNEIIKNREYNTKYKANRKIIIVIDEAHVFIDSKYPLALDFMYQMAKRIRKYNGMQIVITQNIKDFVGSEELARKSTAIINACQYSFIFSLAPNDMHDLCKLYEKAGGINEIEQEQIMAAPRGRAFVVTGPTSRATIQIETPKPIEQMFSEPGYEGRFYAGRQADWEAFIAESRMVRASEVLADLEEGLWEEGEENLPDFRNSGVQLIEVETEEVEEEKETEKNEILIEEVVEDLPQKEEPQRRENATHRALELIHEEAAQSARNVQLNASGDMAGGIFSPSHLQQLGFEALIGEIRRAVKEEVKAEYDVKAAHTVKSEEAVQVMSSAVLTQTLESENNDEESFDDIFQELFNNDEDIREDAEEAEINYEEKNFKEDFDDIFDELFGDVEVSEEESESEEDEEDEEAEKEEDETGSFDDIFDELFKEDFNLEEDSEFEEFSTEQEGVQEKDDDFFSSLWDLDDEEETEKEETASVPKRKASHGEELDLDSIHQLEEEEEEEEEEETVETRSYADDRKQRNALVYEITLDQLLEMPD